MANAQLRDEDQIRKGISTAEFVRKGGTGLAPLSFYFSFILKTCDLK